MSENKMLEKFKLLIDESMKEFDNRNDDILYLDNEYMLGCPADQQLSNQINNLIEYFGKDKVAEMFNIFFRGVK